MKTTTQTMLIAAGLALVGTGSAHTQSVSSSASYTLLHAPPGDTGGGGPVANAGATVTAEVSTGNPASGLVSHLTTNGTQAKGNLVGQLYDVVGLSVSATPATVNELALRQFDAAAILDDATTLALDSLEVSWSENSDALLVVTLLGQALAAPVWETTVARVDGSYGIFADPDGFDLTVVDTGETDNYATYGGDGIDDGWQMHYFGDAPNADAGPGENPDHDPGDNMFEFLTGFNPTDGTSFFHLAVDGFSAPATLDLRLNKLIPGRTYTMTASPDLVTPFAQVGLPFSVAGEETEALFQDPAATQNGNFYRVEVTKP